MQTLLQQATEYFNGNDLAAEVWFTKYRQEGENSPADTLNRVIDAFYKQSLKTPKVSRYTLRKLSAYGKTKFSKKVTRADIASYFDNFQGIIPGGSILANIGTEKYSSTSNCFYVELEDDSMESIFKLGAQLASIFKYRGGCGIDITKLRPNGAIVNNAANTSSGAVSFMPLFSEIARVVGQDGRRAAMMISISINHPDAEAFIKIKQDLTAVTGANISLKITNEFYQAVKTKKKNYIQYWSRLGKQYTQTELFKELGFDESEDYTNLGLRTYELNSGDSLYIKVIDPTKLYTEFIKANHSSAEPGLLFWDNMLDYSMSAYYPQYKELGTNPCQPEWATVLTPNGIRTFKDINVGDLIWSSEGWTTVVRKESSGIKNVYNYQTTAGIFSGTDTHRVISKGNKIEVKDAETIDVLAGAQSLQAELNPLDIMDGLVLGDGSVHKASNNLVYLYIGDNDKDYFDSEIQDLILKSRSKLSSNAYEVSTTILANELPKTFLRSVPERFYKGSSAKVRGFLKGLYSANGSVIGNRVSLKLTSPYMRDAVQIMLSSVGIRSYYTTNKSKAVQFSNGVYPCKESYDINISTDRQIFYNSIGFLQKYKMDALKNSLGKISPSDKTHPITNIEWVSEEEVFHITVNNNSHTYWTGGLNVSNCSEIPLGDKDACRLFAVNLAKLPFKAENTSHLFKQLYELFYEQVILANYLVDIELTHIDRILKKINNKNTIEYQLWSEIRKMTITGRRIGCGITGLFDWLITVIDLLGQTVTAEGILSFTTTLFKIKLCAELDASIDLAIIYGPFKGYSKKETSKFIQMIKETFPAQYERMQKYGRRNVSLSTVAPTGTISILGQCSSGIEPIFAPYYTRKRKVTAEEPFDSIDVDGERFKHYTVVHPGLLRFAPSGEASINWEQVYKQSPYYGWSANEIALDIRLQIQAIAQKYTSHAISSTINLPQETTVEQIQAIYDAAFQHNLKGLTIYRDGSRQGILTTKETTSQFVQYDAPKRPKVLMGDLHKVKVKGVSYIVVIGLYQEKPYEIFAAETTQPVTTQKGKITKLNKGIYKWEGENGEVISNLNILSEDSAERATTIYLSMLMRQGAKMPYIIKAAKKADGNIITFTSAVCRILGKYLASEGQEDLCPDCGSKLIREAGCTKCSNCAYSLCLTIIHEIKN